MKLKYNWKKFTILFLSDMHIPYHHRHSFKFLKMLKTKYKPHIVVSVGDLGDFHDMSFHDSDPDLMSAGDELRALQRYSKELEKIFPNMYIIGSNHGDLPARRAFASKMPKSLLRPYNEIYGVGKGWKFVDDLEFVWEGDTLYVTHGISKNGLKLATQRGVCVAQGHFHTEFRIDYASNPRNLLWSLQTGCLIDKDALAFKYDRLNLQRPIIGTGLSIAGQPKLEPMLLSSDGEWIGRLA